MSADPFVSALGGRTAVVTGAAGGIGRATAVALAAAGAVVYAAGRSEESLAATLHDAARAGSAVVAVSFEARDPGSVRALIRRAAAETGRLDLLVNNAGVNHPGSLADDRLEAWREMIDVNLVAPLVASAAAVEEMRMAGRGGRIVNVTSSAARGTAQGVYGATKAALEMASSTLRRELEGEPIRVTDVVPGAVATNLGRHYPDEALAAAAALLRAAPAGTFMLSPDDVARQIVRVAAEPLHVDLAEVVVRPAADIEARL